MVATLSASSLERIISDLIDAATEIVLWARPKWNSVDLELAVGKLIDARVRREYRFQRWVGGFRRPFLHDNFLSRLSEMVYQLALEAGVERSFLDVELGIWTSIRRIADRIAPRNLPAISVA